MKMSLRSLLMMSAIFLIPSVVLAQAIPSVSLNVGGVAGPKK
jgi:hypothetical protein